MICNVFTWNDEKEDSGVVETPVAEQLTIDVRRPAEGAAALK
jgi:hypothetical protein